MGRNSRAVNVVMILFIWGIVSCGQIIAQSKVEVSKQDLKAKPKYLKETYLINNNLKHYHFRKQELNDSLSSVIFNNFFSSLDFNKTYFFKSDVDYFKKYEFKLDDQIKEGNVELAFQVFKTFRDRAIARMDYVDELISKGFDFSINEELNLDNENVEWASTEDVLNERWRKIIKSQALNLKLSGRDDEGIKESLTERYERFRKGILQYNADDVYQFYMNSYTEAYDPHTNYFSPISSENFNISMSLSLEGIGARLSQSMDYTVVNEVIAGGPAFKSKQLHKDDKIVAVGQGKDEAFVDVIGWRLQDVVQLIRGPKGSIVRLQIIKHGQGSGAVPEEILLVRDKIKLEESSAKSEVVPIKNGNTTYNLGVITLPSFYIDFDAARRGVKDYKSTTRDVKKIITDLKSEDVDGILIDLRYNGGGSLKEAIDLTGLFIDKGPVVQVKSSNGQIDVKRDADPTIQYNGPVMVLINRFSASASEIFSGAIQDYKRGVIVGETSFGKGTVQNLIDLNRMFPSDKDELGQLKLTLAKFYRVTGSSTQNIGVTPDVKFSSPFDAVDFGESSHENSLPWDKIDESNFSTTGRVNDKMVKSLTKSYESNIEKDILLKLRLEDIERAKEIQNRKALSLNLEKRQQEKDIQDDLDKERKELVENTNSEIEGFEVPEEELKKLNEDLDLKQSLRLLANMVDISPN
ncbi:carboxy terminal-processing peptidase [Reichenbachiella versicolor]|uniref:carboxy terminal-processing peptidase n=1 Tax=Reichenbachiella versicolor TaxID=1821036 RepID=UPI000D6E5BC7|nr:carboxy terminal-processing peptidase [Reichenbachiella versicolor]